MAKAREPKVFRSMDDLPLMLTPYDLWTFWERASDRPTNLSIVRSSRMYRTARR